MRHPRLLCFVLSCCVACWACERQTGAPPAESDQKAYFPLHTGRYITYQIDSIVYDFAADGGIRRDTIRYFAREVTGDTFRDNSGRLRYTIERFERKTPDAPWTIRRVWSAGVDENQAVRTEENLSFLKLVFPMDRRSEWDGNLWIDANREIEIAGERMRPFNNWRYEVDSIDVRQTIGAFRFDSVLVVTEADDNNIIERRLSRVKYAKNVGLVWREQLIFDSQYCNKTPPPADCNTRPWTEKAEKGYLLRQMVVDYR